MALTPEAKRAKAQPIVGIGDVADLFSVSKQLAKKWTMTWKDWPAPFAELRAGSFWRTDEVLEVAKAHERRPGEGPRTVGDNRPPSVAKAASRKAARAKATA